MTPDTDERPWAILVDIDGTVALLADRRPHDWERVGEDLPNSGVITVVRAMHRAGTAIIFCTARDESCRDRTERWLAEFVGVSYHALYLRPAGDSRPDTEVKREIFERDIRDYWRIAAVFEDRDQVVRMWREQGLTVFQVADGDF
ncbi:phosphatase domain-containing protein [Streptomyces tendae]|uniref:phosphatase domain-containing protein n=1 Tax=Streptomyces tendae TaxID=1932 RepID=UPI0036808D69